MAKILSLYQPRFLNCLCNWVALWCFVAGFGFAYAQTPPAAIEQFSLYRQDDRLLLSANVPAVLPASVESAVQKGIPLYFVIEAELSKDRWYWFDRKIVNATRHVRLVYQPITRKWKINTGADNTRLSDAGLTLSQSFESLEEAVSALGRVRAWPIVAIADLDPEGRYFLTFRFQLDIAALPKPLQIGLIGQSDWSLGFTKSLRLNPDLWR